MENLKKTNMVQTQKHKLLKIALLILFLWGVFFVFKYFDPAQYSFFYSCPIKNITGYQCAGCGTQRAIHQLLHFNVLEAFRLNSLIVISLPFLLLGIGVTVWNYIFETQYRIKLFYNNKFIIGSILIVILYSVLRNFI